MKKESRSIPEKRGNPFTVPEGYFNSLEERLMKNINQQENVGPGKVSSRKFRLRPYLPIAAAIAGVALITYLILNNLSGKLNQDDYYDIALLEDTGVYYDESLLTETYNSKDMDEDDVWDDEVINYLASNEVHLEALLETY